MLVKELLKVYIFTTVFSDRYAISKINGFIINSIVHA